VKSEYCKEIDILPRKRKEAEVKLQGIATASDDTREELTAGMEDAWNEVRSALHDAVLKIK
jgi:hypothetical protein